MDILDKVFKGFPSQEKVISEMIRSGIRVIDGTAYCNNIEISDSALGRAAVSSGPPLRRSIPTLV